MGKLLFGASVCTCAFILGACSSVSENIPRVKIVKPAKQSKSIKQAAYHQPSRAEAAMVCDNANMQERAQDRNAKNDSARILILEEGSRSSTVIADIEIDCAQYYQSQRQVVPRLKPARRSITAQSYEQEHYGYEAETVKASYTDIPSPAPVRQRRISRQQRPQNLYAPYTVKAGDNLYRIARERCITVNEISAANNIDYPYLIHPRQQLKLPASKCSQ